MNNKIAWILLVSLGVRPPYDTFSNQGNSCLAKLSWNPFKNHIVN